ncbi:MAG TPA: ATP-binding cassette domain-containing protein [Saprospiraceae bacterium]|nr:ATP-binding cassette domain-containing protein [Saprospiraceae bacterium]
MTFKTQHIAKAFGEKKVLKDVSFTLQKGTITVLMGTNGSGKTTLFNILTGFLKADNGEIFLNERNITNKPPYLLNQIGISRTFQDMRLIGKLTVKENVLLAFTNQQGENWWNTFFPNAKVKAEQLHNAEKANKLLQFCFIDHIAQNKADEISYGQQKLLNLACCMANDAEIILLDEPVAGVNPVFRERLTEIIQNLKAQGKAILIIEHNTDFIEQIADEILFLNDGILTRFENYESLRNNPQVQEAYI